MSTSNASPAWSPSSWTDKKIDQDVAYPDHAAVDKALDKLNRLPPIVTPHEIRKLRQRMRDAALGKAFILQGGDCAELFDYCAPTPIENKLKVLLQMSLVLIWGARIPVVRIARMAGQYAKPRSKPTEVVNGVEIMSYRGDNVNGFDPEERIPDPDRLVSAYFHSATTMNYVRGLLNSGFADLHRMTEWNLDHVRSTPLLASYLKITANLTSALDFMRTVGADRDDKETTSVDMYTSHEALLLPYESSLTRKMSAHGEASAYYNVSAHMIWIGDRTRDVDGAHVEYASGIENPVGVKVGPTMKPQELKELLDRINPKKEVGKIMLITRYGASKIENYLPGHIQAVKESGHVVVWSCDPMHGNTEQTKEGFKTRDFANILSELKQAFRIHKLNDSQLNGVHFELTGDRVTECVGGSMELEAAELSKNYQTYCDPRLNYEQSMDMAFLIARYHEKEREGSMDL